jgi:hypothetical protein
MAAETPLTLTSLNQVAALPGADGAKATPVKAKVEVTGVLTFKYDSTGKKNGGCLYVTGLEGCTSCDR